MGLIWNRKLKMLILDDKKILIGGVHDHWHRIDTKNTAYLHSHLTIDSYLFMKDN